MEVETVQPNYCVSDQELQRSAAMDIANEKEEEEEYSEEESEEEDEEDDSSGEEEEDEEEEGEAEVEDSQEAAPESDSEDEDLPQCPICLDKLRDQKIGSPESCDHEFCMLCIVEWSKNTNTCPIDRLPFNIILARNPGQDKVIKRICVETRQMEEEFEIPEEEEDLTACEVCQDSDREDRLLLCDGCDLGYHCECLNPPLADVPVEEWFCPTCAEINRQAAAAEDSTEMEDLAMFPRRQIARTRVSVRVRNRIQVLRMQQRRPLELESNDEEADAAEETAYIPSSAIASRTPSTSGSTPRKRKASTRRKTTKRRKTSKRRTTRKRKTTGKTAAKGKRRGTKKRKTRRKSRTTRRKTAKPLALTRPGFSLTSQAFSAPLSRTIKGRIAERLGLSKPPPGRTIPMQRKVSDRAPMLRKGDNTVTSLSILGDRDELIAFDDMEQDVGSPHILPAAKDSKSILLKDRVPVISRRPVKKPIPASRIQVTPTKSADLLGSIFQGQSLLHMDSKHIQIGIHGTLKATKPLKTPDLDKIPPSPIHRSPRLSELMRLEARNDNDVSSEPSDSPSKTGNPSDDGGSSNEEDKQGGSGGSGNGSNSGDSGGDGGGGQDAGDSRSSGGAAGGSGGGGGDDDGDDGDSDKDSGDEKEQKEEGEEDSEDEDGNVKMEVGSPEAEEGELIESQEDAKAADPEKDGHMVNGEDDESEPLPQELRTPFSLASFLHNVGSEKLKDKGPASPPPKSERDREFCFYNGTFARVNKREVDVRDLDRRLEDLRSKRREELGLLKMYGLDDREDFGRDSKDQGRESRDSRDQGRDSRDSGRDSRKRSRSGSRDRDRQKRRSRSRERRRSRSRDRRRSRSRESRTSRRGDRDSSPDKGRDRDRSGRDRFGRDRPKEEDRRDRRRSKSPRSDSRTKDEDSDRFAKAGWRGGGESRGRRDNSDRSDSRPSSTQVERIEIKVEKDPGFGMNQNQSFGNNQNPGFGGNQNPGFGAADNSGFSGRPDFMPPQNQFVPQPPPPPMMPPHSHFNQPPPSIPPPSIPPPAPFQPGMYSHPPPPMEPYGAPPQQVAPPPPVMMPDYGQPPAMDMLNNGDFDQIKKSLAMLGTPNPSDSGSPGIPGMAAYAGMVPPQPDQSFSGYDVTVKEEPLDDDNMDVDMPGGANDDFQQRVVEEVKNSIRPYFNSRQITKDQYKEILKKCVPKVYNSGEINQKKIGGLVGAYVKKYRPQKSK